MKTDDLVAALAADGQPVDAAAVERRFHSRLLVGAAAALVSMALWLGPRPDLAQATGLPMFWVKLAFPCTVAVAAWWMLHRLGRPGRSLGAAPAALLVPVLALWTLGAVMLLGAPPQDRTALLLGQTWRECAANIALLALPATVLAFSALRGLAPTRLSLAGAAAGAFGGAVAAAAYSLHCPELAPPFLAVWYVLGMAVPAAVGAMLGRRLLRW